MAFGYSKKSLFKFKKIIGIVGGGSGKESKSTTHTSAASLELQAIFNKFVENLPQKNEAISVFSIISYDYFNDINNREFCIHRRLLKILL